MSVGYSSIDAYKEGYRQQLLEVWERSVLATHKFLNPSDFEEIKALVQAIDFNLFEVYCLLDADKVFGFIGVADKKIEMLFLLPEYFGSGYGKMLVTFAVQQLGANKVDVNEQNTNATNFYKHLGFETYERSEKDDQGKNYPLLRMKLH